ncbi:MAG: helix-turn-helix transcriptional regulator [Xanthobacteraceae bacterium]
MRVESLVDDIYGAVADPALWPSLIARVADYTGTLGGMLAYINLRRNENMMVIGRLSPVFAKVYEDHYLNNPWNKALERVAPTLDIVSMSSLVPFAKVAKTRFNADVLVPGTIVDGLNVLLPSLAIEGGFGGLHFSIYRAREKWADESRRRLQELAPHLRRALEATIKIAPLISENRQLERILSLMPTTALLVDRRRRVCYANQAAETLFAARDGLALDGERRLSAGNVPNAEALAFSLALRQALDVSAGSSEAIGEPVRLSRLSGAGPLLVIPVPLPPPAFELWRLSEPARALVLVVDPTAHRQPMISGLQRAFGLTTGEARVAVQVSNGLSGPQAARALGVTPHTVKTHLARCFDKIGVHSQVGLARLLSAWPATEQAGKAAQVGSRDP